MFGFKESGIKGALVRGPNESNGEAVEGRKIEIRKMALGLRSCKIFMIPRLVRSPWQIIATDLFLELQASGTVTSV